MLSIWAKSEYNKQILTFNKIHLSIEQALLKPPKSDNFT